MGKWLNSSKSLTVRRNKYNQRLGGRGTNIINDNKEKYAVKHKGVNEHLQKLSKVPQSKLKQKMISTSDKVVKCKKEDTITNRCNLNLNLCLLIKGLTAPPGRTHASHHLTIQCRGPQFSLHFHW